MMHFAVSAVFSHAAAATMATTNTEPLGSLGFSINDPKSENDHEKYRLSPVFG